MSEATLVPAPEPVIVVEPRAAIAPTTSAPLAPYTHIRRFNRTGGVQDFTVPPGVTTVNARCWGGGGYGTNTGGGGGFATGNIAVVPGETLRVVVDMGREASWQGGGMSGLYSQRLGQTLLIAGGGGASNVAGAPGGAGGGTSGSDGRPLSQGGWTGTPARGASGSTGGAGATISGDRRYGGRGGSTGQNGGANADGSPGGQVPIPGMGAGAGAGYGGNSGGGAGYAGGGGGVATAGGFSSGGAGGSSFVNGPGVTGGQTLPGNGTQAGGQNDPLYQSPVGNAGAYGNPGQVVLQWTEFTVTPGGPPDVELAQGGAAGYPGVRVEAGVAFDPVSVTVSLPVGSGLLFGMQTLADYQLTVQNADGQTTPYMGTLSEDGTSLVFSGVDLQLPGTSVMWVAVSAGHDAPLGATALAFTVGGKPCPSTTIVVTPAFTVSPGGSPVTAERGGSPVYPGAEVRNDGAQTIPLQTVTAALPAGVGMRFGTPDNPDHQLTVWDAAGNITVYIGSNSDDGQSLTFFDIDLGIPDDGSRSVMWVCVSAADDTPQGPTSLEFTVGGRTSPSTTINVI